MDSTNRIIVNVIAQYLKAIINTCLSLYTVRVVLAMLGQSDYGIMSIIGGVIGFLGFMTNAMVITTQRHLSYSYGLDNKDITRATFSNSIILHCILGGFVFFSMLLLKNIIVSPAVLNIEDGRWYAAGWVYVITATILLTSFITAPFKALLIARENIVLISAIEVMDGLAKLAMVLCLSFINSDKLIVYMLMMLFIVAMEFTIYVLYDIVKFPECSPKSFICDYDKAIIKQLSSFAGWTTYATGSIMCRNQGIAWCINQFFGTVVNASYGIANQMFSAVLFISTSILNAMNPQIMKKEGQGDRLQMLNMAARESKMVVCIMSIVFIPLMMEIQPILEAWLGDDVPPYTALLCNTLLIMVIVDQLTSGLNTAIQAIGKIKVYTLLMYTPKLLYVCLAYLFLKANWELDVVCMGLILTELLVALSRIPFLRIEADMEVKPYIYTVFPRNTILIVSLIVISYFLHSFLEFDYAYLVIIPLTVLCGFCLSWFIILEKFERMKLKTIMQKIIHK